MPKDSDTKDRISSKEIEDMMQRYKEKLNKEFRGPLTAERGEASVRSLDYQEFRQEFMPKRLSIYEKLCNMSEKLLKIAPDKKKTEDYEEAIRICHLSTTPTGVVSFAVIAPLLLIVMGSVISYLLFQSMFFIMFFLIAGAAIYAPLNKLPMFLANSWRMKASNQMVLCIFYVVTYMRHTSNLELGMRFASDHLAPPLSIDLKKILWDVETEKYESIKESLDSYLDTWKKYNMEFIEAFHLVESSLYEGDEDRRISLLDKSLSVILDETYEKMLHYAQNLKSPITMLHMLGIILPILGLVILPLVVSFMCQVEWYHLAALYNVALPIIVYYLGKNILSTRPTGYGDTDVSEENPELKKYRNIIIPLGPFELKIRPMIISIIFIILFVGLGISPLVLHMFTADSNWDLIVPKKGDNLLQTTYQLEDPDEKFALLGYRKSLGCPPGETNSPGFGEVVGPFGLGAAIFSLLLIIGLGVGIGLYFRFKASNVIKIRDKAKQLEKEFASALFQLGNRLGDGLPAEIAFSKVAAVMGDSVSGSFFTHVSMNITRMGMGVEAAIFDPKHGALVYYPSSLIESSMKVLTESAKKGPAIAARAVISVSRYIKEIHRVDERLKDLMADTISSMKSQIKFLTPAIAGIVIGITSMITTILGQLGVQLRTLTSGQDDAAQMGGAGGMINMFGEGVPTFYFQIIVGFYVVQLIYILTIITNGIENGSDSLGERFALGKNLITSTLSYAVIALIIMLVFNLIAGTIMGKLNLGGA
ncbi:hypothetical protein GF345_06000 [Candidatus Woesearchaeota archaeon]|nr:hypothetical protein [Candidatus Woesearchaeota archaeon]